MEEDKGAPITSNQKDIIYRKMLMPLKTKISQILLYDTKAALEFLQIYNEIIENDKQPASEILEAISDLEIKIGLYENSKGKEKVFEERNKAVLQMIDDLRVNSIQLSLEEFEREFSQLKNDYDENIQNYSFKDREKIEREFYALKASLIMRQVAGGKTKEELEQAITKEDKIGLNIFISEQINSLRQRDDLKDVANKVSNIVMTDSNAVLKPELWSWMNAAEKGKSLENQSQIGQSTTSTAMIVAPRNKNITLIDIISRIFSKEPNFPLQTIDLKKINIEWLCRYIPKSMLLELENQRLSKEKVQVDNRYVPDSKTVIYRMFEKREKERIKKVHGELLEDVKQYEFLKENGGKLEVIISEYRIFKDSLYPYMTNVQMKAGDIIKEGIADKYYHGDQVFLRLNDALAYANLLDKTFNTNFQQQLLQEIQDIFIDKIRKKSPVYDNMIVSFDNMLQVYDQTKIDFKATEEAKRKKFYGNNFNQQDNFRNSIKVLEDKDLKKDEKKDKKKDKKVNIIDEDIEQEQ